MSSFVDKERPVFTGTVSLSGQVALARPPSAVRSGPVRVACLRLTPRPYSTVTATPGKFALNHSVMVP